MIPTPEPSLQHFLNTLMPARPSCRCLEALVLATPEWDPAMLWVVDGSGRMLACLSRRSSLDASRAASLVPQCLQLAHQSQPGAMATFTDQPTQRPGFAMSVSVSDDTAVVVAGLFDAPADPASAAPPTPPHLAPMAQLAAMSVFQHEAARQAKVRIDQLQIEQQQQRTSYAQLMETAVEERELRLKHQQEYAQELEIEVARRAIDLRKALEVAEAANAAKGDFLASVSHEIRTPMTAILGYTDLLVQHSRGRHQTVEWLEIIRRNGKHLLSVIEDVLDISRIEAGKMRIEPMLCSLSTLLHEVRDLMAAVARAKSLELRIETEPGLPARITTDPVRLRQIIINLVGNALKFTDQGHVAVKASIHRAVQGEPSGDMLRIEVSDTGSGIAPDVAARLFQPFSQGDGSVTRRHGGTGLGLAISRHLAQMLGGDISLRSTPGEGSCFTVLVNASPIEAQMPADDAFTPPSAQAAPSAVLEAANAAPTKVLLVDDMPDNRMLLSLLLKRMGLDVQDAANGKLGVEAALARTAAGQPFDLIFMDMQMPVMDGYQATQKLRQEGHKGPILALTAHAMASERAKCLAAGCDECLTKPIEIDKIKASLRRFVPRFAPATP